MEENPIQPLSEHKIPDSDNQKSVERVPPSAGSASPMAPQKDALAPSANEEKPKRKPLSRFEVWIIVLTAIGILVAAGTGGAIIWQDILASQTLGELQKQYPE